MTSSCVNHILWYKRIQMGWLPNEIYVRTGQCHSLVSHNNKWCPLSIAGVTILLYGFSPIKKYHIHQRNESRRRKKQLISDDTLTQLLHIFKWREMTRERENKGKSFLSLVYLLFCGRNSIRTPAKVRGHPQHSS